MKAGLQLYNFRNELAADFKGALREIAKIGFDGDFYSQTTRYHQGIASQLLAYAIAGQWWYLRKALENSKSLKKLRSYVGYTYGKKYVLTEN